MRLSLPSPQPWVQNVGGDLGVVAVSKKAGMAENADDGCSVTVASTITSSWTMSSRRVVEDGEQPQEEEEEEEEEDDKADFLQDPRQIMREILVARRAGVTRSSSTGSRSSIGSGNNSSVGYYDPASFVSELSFRSCDDLSNGYGDACSVGGTVVSTASTSSTVCQKYPSAAEVTARHISKRRGNLLAKELNWSIKPDVLLDDGILSNPIHEMPLDEEEEESEEEAPQIEDVEGEEGQTTEDLPQTMTPLSAVCETGGRRVSPRRFIRLRRRYYTRPKPTHYYSAEHVWDGQCQSYDNALHWDASFEAYNYEPHDCALPEDSENYESDDDELLGEKFLDDEEEDMAVELYVEVAPEQAENGNDDFPAVCENIEYNDDFEYGFDEGYYVEQKEECMLSSSSSLTSLEELGEAHNEDQHYHARVFVCSHCGSEQTLCPAESDDETASTESSRTSTQHARPEEAQERRVLSSTLAAVSHRHRECMALKTKFAVAMTKELGGKFASMMGRDGSQDNCDCIKPWWENFALWGLSLQG